MADFKKRKTNNPTYKEIGSSESDAVREIYTLEDIIKSTSSWEQDDCNALRITFRNANTISDMVQQHELDGEYLKLVLPNWNMDTFKNPIYSGIDRKVSTIIDKAGIILARTEKDSKQEADVDSLVMSLMIFLRFDDYPLQLQNHPHVLDIKRQDLITSIPDYAVVSRAGNENILVVVEDKDSFAATQLDNWSEPQIAGEIFASAIYNSRGITGIKYPYNIIAMRVIGTRFTFYKTVIKEAYMRETRTKLPRTSSMEILRYPQQLDPSNGLVAWNFCDENDRLNILKTLRSIEGMAIGENV